MSGEWGLTVDLKRSDQKCNQPMRFYNDDKGNVFDKIWDHVLELFQGKN